MSATILVVEDESIVAEDIRATLKSFGYAVPHTVPSGEEAIRLAEQQRPDLVLLDIRLQGKMDGAQAALVFRERFDVPVVYLTSQSDDATVARAQLAEPYGYVIKPFSDRELRMAIKVALQRHELESRLKAVMQELSEKRTLLEAVFSSMEDGVMVSDLEGKVLLCNEAASRHVGLSVKSSEESVAYLSDQKTVCSPEQLPMARALRGETVRQTELFVANRQGADGQWHSFNASPLRDARGVVRGGVAVGRNVTELKKLEIELQRQSIIDELTGLYNRRGFFMLAEQQLKTANRSGRAPALVYADLNGMKSINDQMGHDQGDMALCDAAALLRDAFRDSDIVGRLGGDEFVVLALEASPASSAVLRARLEDKIDAFNGEMRRRYRLSMSIGVKFHDAVRGESIETLVNQADRLMYEQKQLRQRRGPSLAPRVLGREK